MSTAKEVAEHAGNACVGALALMLGDTRGGSALVAGSVIGFALFARQLKTSTARYASKRAANEALAAIKDSPELQSANMARAAYLLENAHLESNDTSKLLSAIRAAKGIDIAPPLAELVLSSLTLDGDDPATIEVVRLALNNAARACASVDGFENEMRSLMLMTLVRDSSLQSESLRSVDAKVDRFGEQLVEMRELMVRRTRADRPRLADEHGELMLTLAERYLPEPTTDFMVAYRGIKAALVEYERIQAKKSTSSNVGEQTGILLARLDGHNSAGQFDEAMRVIAGEAAAARERIGRETSGLAWILDLTVSQARLGNNPRDAALALVEKLRIDNPTDLFAALNSVQDEWYARGRDGGLPFDLEVASHLAHSCHTYGTTPEQLGNALNNLGRALLALGVREVDTARLEAAVAAHHDALKELTRDRVPLLWATTQMLLGNALRTLGERRPDPARLAEAINAYREALYEQARDKVPLDWARTQMNLGTALRHLGKLEPGTVRLKQAVTACRNALRERNRDDEPFDWARSQVNLGNALRSLGLREAGTKRLRGAIKAHTVALEEWTRDRVPLDWARAQMNLAAALQSLGERKTGTKDLNDAVAASHRALLEFRRDQEPLDWANTIGIQGLAKCVLAERTKVEPLAFEALQLLREASIVLRTGGHFARADVFFREISRAEVLVARISATGLKA